MCTVSWIHETDGYHLLCNRDEKLTRLPAHPPVVGVLNSIRFIAPRDADSGGTWMSVNEFGVSLCLLNGAGPRPGGVQSRGAVVMSAAASKSAQAAMDGVSELSVEAFAPFQLIAVDRLGHSCLFVWNGSQTEILEDAASLMPLTSSSFDPQQVLGQRRDSFRRRCAGAATLTPELLFDFHCSHDKHPSAYSTCMHRDDAATVSFSWVTVRANEVSYLYSPAAPCQWAAGEVVKLEVSP